MTSVTSLGKMACHWARGRLRDSGAGPRPGRAGMRRALELHVQGRSRGALGGAPPSTVRRSPSALMHIRGIGYPERRARRFTRKSCWRAPACGGGDVGWGCLRIPEAILPPPRQTPEPVRRDLPVAPMWAGPSEGWRYLGSRRSTYVGILPCSLCLPCPQPGGVASSALTVRERPPATKD